MFAAVLFFQRLRRWVFAPPLWLGGGRGPRCFASLPAAGGARVAPLGARGGPPPPPPPRAVIPSAAIRSR
ncbi:hypothetical protein, partial [Nocardia abscessus]|uniref:hypothetical protein n=1 Tax=Nocardia abscessus TaxID=120957 RepID=UPI0024546478